MEQDEAYDWQENCRSSYDLAIAELKKKFDAIPRVDIASIEGVQIGTCTVFHADIKEIYELLPKADCLVTDPPYRLTSGGSTPSRHLRMKGGWMKGYNNNGQVVECDIVWDDILELCYLLCATNADAYVMANDKNLLPCLTAAQSAGFGIHNILVWDKINATANRWYMKNVEFTAYLWKGTARRINDCGSKQLVRIKQIDETTHPTEKPVELMKYYIANSSKERDTILDPFMGSGTTGIAALSLNRNFIGVEKNKTFFDMAVQRLQAAVSKGRQTLFQN